MLKTLGLQNYRNIEKKKINLSDKFTWFIGPNGIGKTNILESVHFFANMRSFRYLEKLSSLITENKTNAKVEGVFNNYNLRYDVTKEKKKFYFNGNQKKGLYELLDFVSVVSYAPTFYDLVNTGNNLRISYLDKVAFILDKSYLLSLQQYKKVLKERNSALKKKQQLDTWDKLLVKYGIPLIEKRDKAVSVINSMLKNIHSKKLFVNEISLHYKTNIKDNFEALLYKNRTKDYLLTYTSIGPHRDQLDILLAKKQLRGFLSTGESKLITFLLKMVELSLSKDKFDETIFIYDDAGAFLDKSNFTILIDMLGSLDVQVLLSSVNNKMVASNKLNDSVIINLNDWERSFGRN